LHLSRGGRKEPKIILEQVHQALTQELEQALEHPNVPVPPGDPCLKFHAMHLSQTAMKGKLMTFDVRLA
jgi:hypothetical protein